MIKINLLKCTVLNCCDARELKFSLRGGRYYIRPLCSVHRHRKYAGLENWTGPRKHAYSGAGWITTDGYREFQKNNRRILEHRLVWENIHGPIPKGMVIHHINGIKLDNASNNLCLMSQSEHLKLHLKDN